MATTMLSTISTPLILTLLTTLATAQTPTSSASAALSSASILAALPACGPPCIEPALATSGCSLTNLTCICTDVTFNCAVGPCQLATCSTSELQDQLIPYVANLCASADAGNFNRTICPNLTANTTGIGNLTNISTIVSATPTPSSFTGEAVGRSVSGAILGGTFFVVAMGAVVALL